MKVVKGSNTQDKKVCARCKQVRVDDVDSNICGSCADDLRDEENAQIAMAQADADEDATAECLTPPERRRNDTIRFAYQG